MPENVKIVEVGPRDGLQNQQQPVALAAKRRFIELLVAAGVREIEAGAFVRADRVPQMAESENILDGVDLRGARAYFLVANDKGLERALKAGVKAIAVFTAASDAFNEKNIGMSRKESAKVLGQLVPEAKKAGLVVRGYVSTAWVCPYAGEVPVKAVLEESQMLFEAGCFEVSLGDTIGAAHPIAIKERLRALKKEFPVEKLAVHLHDTYGRAVANVTAALEEGVRTIDSAAGGLGGCPFAPGATGNVGTEDVVDLCEKSGFQTGIDLEKLAKASLAIYQALGLTTYASRRLQALVAARAKTP